MQQLLNHHLPPNGTQPSLEVRMLVTCCMLCYTALLRFDDLSRVLACSDLLRIYPGKSAEVFLWKSKTDQQAEGAYVTVGATSGPHCIVGMLEDVLLRGGYDCEPQPGIDNGPLLRAVATDASGAQRLERVRAPLASPLAALPYSKMLERVNDLFDEAGITKRIGLHGFGIAGATEAVSTGAYRVMVQKLGRWRSTAMFEKVYVKDSVAAKRKVTARMARPSRKK